LAGIDRFAKAGKEELRQIIFRARIYCGGRTFKAAAPRNQAAMIEQPSIERPSASEPSKNIPEPLAAAGTLPVAPSSGGGKVVLHGRDKPPIVLGKPKRLLTPARYKVIKALLDQKAKGIERTTEPELESQYNVNNPRKVLKALAESDHAWKAVIITPEGRKGAGYGLR
jgi:hypothetical protein